MSYLDILNVLQKEICDRTAELVQIKSVGTDPIRVSEAEVYPFGCEVQHSLVHTLELGKSLGFEVKNFDNYAGHIEFKGLSEDEVFGIIGHLDVVPEGHGWDDDPYSGLVKEGYLYGRGTSDDKGPVIACLYAMTAIKDAGIVPKKTIRLVLGLDEETGNRSMEHYIEAAGQPNFGITPDGDFPVINGEMGILIFDIAQKLKKHSVKEGLVLSKLQGGVAPNAVPGKARAVLASKNKSEYEGIQEKVRQFVKETGYNVKSKRVGSSLAIEAFGAAAHGSKPDLGLNAISILMALLGSFDFAGEEVNEFIEFYNSHIGFDLSGERLGCHLYDESSGNLILNVGMAEFNDEIASVTINIRFPVTFSGDDVFNGIEGVLYDNLGIIKSKEEKPIFIDADTPFVNSLMEAYIEQTGDMEHGPIVIGGGTYAKSFDNVLAFGALFPGEEDLMHMENERISLDSLEKMSRIYAAAIYKLCCE